MAHGAHVDLCDGAYRRKGFAAESHGVESEEVVGTGDFGCGMALEGQACVGGAHAGAVVNDLYERPSGVFDDYLDFGGAGVYGVFHEFFHHRCGPLDDFAGSNLVGHGVGQEFYNVAHI